MGEGLPSQWLARRLEAVAGIALTKAATVVLGAGVMKVRLLTLRRMAWMFSMPLMTASLSKSSCRYGANDTKVSSRRVMVMRPRETAPTPRYWVTVMEAGKGRCQHHQLV